MATVHIIYGKYYDFDKNLCTIGGIQTYISNLLPIIAELNMNCIIYQNDCENREVILDNVKIIGVQTNKNVKVSERVKQCLGKCMSVFDNTQDMLLFASDTNIIKNEVFRSIAIQHGVYWDMPVHENFSHMMNELYIFSKVRLTYKTIKNLRKVNRVVCVDHNFPNWLRASCAYQAVKLDVIPNFTEIAPVNDKPTDRINIIFARRFEKYRGTRIFTEAITRILNEYSNVYVTLAGTGPDEQYMKKTLEKFSDRTEFITYKSGESLKVHADKHIAVIPTVGSEGTSLSLLEAMSSQCSVICTGVGGMTNIVLDGYNGLIADRTAEALYKSMKALLDDGAKREKLSSKAYETVKEAFSYDVWAEKWKQIFIDMMN